MGRAALKLVAVVGGAVVIVLFPPFLPLWLLVLFIRRKRRGQPGVPLLPLLSRPGRVAFFAVGWLGLLLAAGAIVASSLSTSVDEHAAPVVAFFVMLGLFLIVAADLVLQAAGALVRAVAPRLRA